MTAASLEITGITGIYQQFLPSQDIINDNTLAIPPVLPPGSHSPPTPTSQLSLEEEPLIIKGCLVSIAYNYVKRKNVFRLTTQNGSEYLLQVRCDVDDDIFIIYVVFSFMCAGSEHLC